jgi:hypothetical protein
MAGGGTPDWESDVVPDGESVVLYRLDKDEALQLRPLVSA